MSGVRETKISCTVHSPVGVATGLLHLVEHELGGMLFWHGILDVAADDGQSRELLACNLVFLTLEDGRGGWAYVRQCRREGSWTPHEASELLLMHLVGVQDLEPVQGPPAVLR